MKTRNIRLCAVTVCMAGALQCSGATLAGGLPGAVFRAEVPDSLYDEEEAADTTGKSRRNYATQFNALKYILEKRYRNYGDTFTHKWDDHLFFDVGVGYYQELHSGRNDLSAVTLFGLGVGKQFNRLHTARVKAALGYGYFEGSKNEYRRVQLAADWMFSLSTYMFGYRPSRLLDVSTMVGVSYRWHNQNGVLNDAAHRMGIRVGLHIRMFTGPQGYVTLEPYAGVSGRQLDNKFGGFYGVNLGYIYYLHNNLSIEERMKYMKPGNVKDGDGRAVAQQMPSSWRTPWFFELSGGVSKLMGGGKGIDASLGNATLLAVGKWFSPVAGLRAGFGRSDMVWKKSDMTVGEQNEERRSEFGLAAPTVYKYDYRNINNDIRVEALVNPLGFKRGYDWNSPFSMYLALGGGVSWLCKNQSEALRTTAVFYTAGLNMSCRLADGLRLFVEPSFANYNYRIPYVNINRSQRYSDNVMSVRLGVSATTCAKAFRPKAGDGEAGYDLLPVSFGVGVGASRMYARDGYSSGSLHLSANVFGEYKFSRISGVRLAFDFMDIRGKQTAPYSLLDGEGDVVYTGQAMYTMSNRRGIVSLDYLLDMSNAFAGYRTDRRFSLELFAGPSLMFGLGDSRTLDSEVRAASAYSVEQGKQDAKGGLVFGVNGGVKLRYNATRHLAVTLTPQLNMLFGRPHFYGIGFMGRLRGIETLHLGVQYSL